MSVVLVVLVALVVLVVLALLAVVGHAPELPHFRSRAPLPMPHRVILALGEEMPPEKILELRPCYYTGVLYSTCLRSKIHSNGQYNYHASRNNLTEVRRRAGVFPSIVPAFPQLGQFLKFDQKSLWQPPIIQHCVVSLVDL